MDMAYRQQWNKNAKCWNIKSWIAIVVLYFSEQTHAMDWSAIDVTYTQPHVLQSVGQEHYKE